MPTELNAIRIWRNPKSKFWHRGFDRTTTLGLHATSIEAFLCVREHCLRFGYERDVVLESITGEEIITRVGRER